MITKKQWNKFCFDLMTLKNKVPYGGLALHGRSISDVQFIYDPLIIITRKAGTAPIFYKFKESFSNYTTLEKLYDSITVTTSMQVLKKLGLFDE